MSKKPIDNNKPIKLNAKETWGTQIGVILAVMGSAVGLGNFLRFPGVAAQNGGGAFMIPYIVAFLLLGLPMMWAEWAMGRYGGRQGFNSPPGIYRAVWKSRLSPYVGALALLVPIVIYMYYVFIEGWCLAYAIFYLTGDMNLGNDPAAYSQFFGDFVGMNGPDKEAGYVFGFFGSAGFFLVICFALNFFLIYRGLTKGIELFCKWAMPALIICAVIILIRVLTLGTPDPNLPYQNVENGLGFMWNPVKTQQMVDEMQAPPIETSSDTGTPFKGVLVSLAPVKEPIELLTNGSVEELIKKPVEAVPEEPATLPAPKTLKQTLMSPQPWIAAAGQIFFSLSLGFGIILTYSSYMKKDDDIALAGLTAASGNGFCEVVLGGLITIPAAFMFLGPQFLATDHGTFDMGFHALPNVFNQMPHGALFGFLFFFLLFLAAVTSSLSMLQSTIALLEEGLGLNRKASVAILGSIAAIGSFFVVANSTDLMALDTLDFWACNFFIYLVATIQVIMFGWVLGVDRGMEELKRGAEIRIPWGLKFVIKFITPAFLILLFVWWLYGEFVKPIIQLKVYGDSEAWEACRLYQICNDSVVQQSLLLMAILLVLLLLIISQSVKRWRKLEAEASEAGQPSDDYSI